MTWYLNEAKAASDSHRQQALTRQGQLTKPPGSLGQLELLAVNLASLQHTHCPAIHSPKIRVFAGDHGIAEAGVSAFPQSVTAQMVANFSAGGAAITVLAKSLNANFRVTNLGTVTELPELAGVDDQRIAAGTANFLKQAAMTEAQCLQALSIGAACVDERDELWIGGEMGIANTTAATTLACALLHLPAKVLTGPGTGLDSQGQQHKAAVIDQALAFHKAHKQSTWQNLQNFGGFEIAALVGAYISAAQKGVPVLVDGFICTIAARYAMHLNPSIKPWLLLSHYSAEPAHRALIDGFNYPPLLDLQLRLGEASGAALAVPLLQLACKLHNEMATFADAGVSDKPA